MSAVPEIANRWSAAERCAIGFGVVLIALPWLAVYSFESIAFLMFLGAVLAAGPQVFSQAWQLARGTGPGRLLMALAVWLVLSSSWSPEPLQSFQKALGVSAHFGAGLIFIAAAGQISDARQQRLLIFVVSVVAVICAIDFIELATGARVAAWGKHVGPPPGTAPADVPRLIHDIALLKISRGSTVIAVLAGPAVYLAARLPKGALWAAALGVAAAAAVALMPNDTAKIAIAAAGAAALLAWRWPRATLRGISVLAGAAMLGVPWLVHAGVIDRFLALSRAVKISAFHRLEIYRYASELVSQRPLFGWGFDASRYLSRSAPRIEVDAVSHVTVPLISLHPHDAMIQIWLETGAVGAVIAALLCLALGRTLSAWVRSPGQAAAVAAMLAAILTVFAFGYGIWQYQWIAVLLIAGGVVRFALTPRPAVPLRPAQQR